MNTLSQISRNNTFFECDITDHDHHLRDLVITFCLLVIGGAQSILQVVISEMFKRNFLVLNFSKK